MISSPIKAGLGEQMLIVHPGSSRQSCSSAASIIERVPQHDHIDDRSLRAEVILLPFTIALPQFATLTMEESASQFGLHNSAMR